MIIFIGLNLIIYFNSKINIASKCVYLYTIYIIDN